MTQDVSECKTLNCPQCRDFWFKISAIPRITARHILTFCQHAQISVHSLAISTTKQRIALGCQEKLATALACQLPANIGEWHDWCDKDKNNYLLVPGGQHYPASLLQIGSPPAVLFVRGNPETLSHQQLAIVGSRAPSHYGKTLARSLTTQAIKCGWTITSGLAVGIDGICHQAALENEGCTIAILGSGIEYIYPRRHIALSERILATGGALVSEFGISSHPKAAHFPRRNRLVSGLSLGTLVIEAALKSGSLITARCALEQNREVFAVPGNVNNALSRGTHYLIKQGAKLVEDISDINEEFPQLGIDGDTRVPAGQEKKPNASLATDQLLDSVEHDVTAVDVIAERSNLPIQDVMATLLEYELRGLVAAVPGGYIKLGES
ncbi:DNA-processing protein DprA [Aestuariibacter salexigens]|uniref:DNA-processing protein DprA n=1 Tax=Aestuariibacter salexigens TaxID=226010 RepID=UPI00041AA77A|nr:DNA-processing protein DprA [Aestuariibacter salexigens]